MNRLSRLILSVWVLAALGVILPGMCGWTHAADLRLEKVLADWQKRQQRMRTVEYQVSGEHKVARGAYNPLCQQIGRAPADRVDPPEDTSKPVSFTILLDFEKGRYRRELKNVSFGLDTGKFTSCLTKETFNGSDLKTFTPAQHNPLRGPMQPELSIMSGDMRHSIAAFDDPIFFGHGRIHTVMEPIVPGQLRHKPDPEYLFIRGTAVHGDRACLIVRTRTLKMGSETSYDEYWVDTVRDSAIVRYLLYVGDKPNTDMTIRYRKWTRGKVPLGWSPDSWRLTTFHDGRALYSEDLRVNKVQFDPAITDADFDLDVIKPGMIVEEVKQLPTRHPLAIPESEVSVYRVKEGDGREYLPDPYHRKGDTYPKQVRKGNAAAAPPPA